MTKEPDLITADDAALYLAARGERPMTSFTPEEIKLAFAAFSPKEPPMTPPDNAVTEMQPKRAAHILRDHLYSFEMRFSRAENLAQVARMKELADLACSEIDAQDAECLAAGRASAVTPIECNLPFERIPECACDPGRGPIPTKAKRLECKLSGPCSPVAMP